MHVLLLKHSFESPSCGYMNCNQFFFFLLNTPLRCCVLFGIEAKHPSPKEVTMPVFHCWTFEILHAAVTFLTEPSSSINASIRRRSAAHFTNTCTANTMWCMLNLGTYCGQDCGCAHNGVAAVW
jgi:hypothetical protein